MALRYVHTGENRGRVAAQSRFLDPRANLRSLAVLMLVAIWVITLLHMPGWGDSDVTGSSTDIGGTGVTMGCPVGAGGTSLLSAAGGGEHPMGVDNIHACTVASQEAH